MIDTVTKAEKAIARIAGGRYQLHVTVNHYIATREKSPITLRQQSFRMLVTTADDIRARADDEPSLDRCVRACVKTIVEARKSRARRVRTEGTPR